MDSYSSLAAVGRTCQVLEGLVGHPNGLSVTELVNRTNISKSNISRILTTLKENGFVEQDDHTRYYKLSFEFLSLTYRHINALGIENLLQPLLKSVSEKTKELLQLAIVKEEGIFFVAKVEGSNPLKVASMLGQKAPYHAAAVGKMWLSSLSNNEVLNILGKTGLKAHTDYTITNIEELLKDLDLIRKRGYALSNEELHKDVVAIAFPIYNNQTEKKVIASLVIAIPKFRVDEKLIEKLVHTCNEELQKFDTSVLSPLGLGYLPNSM